jgi:SpoVK/Ycf46/Vps4 family AAA+-type ATPase
MAEHARRPLYYIGAGELGDYAKEIEPQLKRIFNLAKSWQAILLLDEADVFLAKRTSDDIFRNGFVSVFLRLLEYYEGILFLTTNRLEEFDPAFQSRLRLRLAYKELDATKRSRIWRNMLRQLKDCKSWDNEVFEKLGWDFEVNGREINNLLRTAVAVATYKGTPLTVSILKSVYDLNFS